MLSYGWARPQRPPAGGDGSRHANELEKVSTDEGCRLNGIRRAGSIEESRGGRPTRGGGAGGGGGESRSVRRPPCQYLTSIGCVERFGKRRRRTGKRRQSLP